MKSKFLKSITLLSLASLNMASAQNIVNGEGWNTPEAANQGLWDYKLSPEEVSAMKGGGGNYWVFTAASSATPYQSGYTYTYGGAGCMNASGNGDDAFFDQNINIPDGHTITFMRFYYEDTDPANAPSARLQLFDGEGGFSEIAVRTSDTDDGYNSVGQSMNYVVDNVAGALNLRFAMQDTSTAQPCGVRLVVTPN